MLVIVTCTHSAVLLDRGETGSKTGGETGSETGGETGSETVGETGARQGVRQGRDK